MPSQRGQAVAKLGDRLSTLPTLFSARVIDAKVFEAL